MKNLFFAVLVMSVLPLYSHAEENKTPDAAAVKVPLKEPGSGFTFYGDSDKSDPWSGRTPFKTQSPSLKLDTSSTTKDKNEYAGRLTDKDGKKSKALEQYAETPVPGASGTH